MNVLIFANGEAPEKGWEWMRPYLAGRTTLIAADGGARHLQSLGLLPQVVIGDLDSLDGRLRERYQDNGVTFIEHQQDKDETDLELALLYASGHFQGEMLVFGSTGGRLDQTLSNVLMLALPELDGRQVTLVDRHQKAWRVETETVVEGKVGDRLSLLTPWGACRVRRSSGLKWNLLDETLVPGPARGVSNELTAEMARIEIAEGSLLCVHTSADWDR